MNASTFWFAAVEDYLTYRHNLGFALKIEGGQLRRFAEFAAQTDASDRFTQALAESWARNTRHPNPLTWARRLEVLRGFALFLKRQRLDTEIPPPGLFGPSHRRRIPHIFSETELAELLAATQHAPPTGGLRSITCRTLFGLLAAAGLRIGEAVQLSRSDVDLNSGVLTIREAKRHKNRLVPVHESVRSELQAYGQQRDRGIPVPRSDHFFLLDTGCPINARQARYAFRCILQSLHWLPRGDYARHRLHDLRHTFIVRSLLESYRQNIDPARAVLLLATYVGHVRVTDTYWYTPRG
jgi:integrase